MSEKAPDPRKVYLKGVRLSYPHLWVRQKANPEAEPKFSASFLIDPSTKQGKKNIAAIERAITAAKEKKWGKPDKKIKPDRLCFIDGNDVVDDEDNVKKGYEDMMVIKASNKDVFRRLHRNKKEAEKDDDPFYAGCYVECILNLYGTDNGNVPGVFASLDGIRFEKDGERFGSEGVTDDDFDDYEDDDDEDDDLLGGDDDEDDDD